MFKNKLSDLFPALQREIALPEGETEESLLKYLGGFDLEGEELPEMDGYLREDLRRFVHTINLLPSSEGELLEVGANPYFISILIKKYTDYNLSCTNYFNVPGGEAVQTRENPDTGDKFEFQFTHHNIDADPLPYDRQFDVVLFCEVIEHLINDPMQAILRLKQSLKEGGTLILTTPNVNRLENVARMVAGLNHYDPYSSYGPYGRHNREYNKHELFELLTHCGFEVDALFASDVHTNRTEHYFPCGPLFKILKQMPNRNLDLGQYIFVRARNVAPAKEGRPSWLYRSFPDLV